jgi:hypothetical protein
MPVTLAMEPSRLEVQIGAVGATGKEVEVLAGLKMCFC